MQDDVLTEVKHWIKAVPAADIPEDGGVCIKHGAQQIAVFNFSRLGQYYATQNLCPHKQQMILSRGMIGDKAGIPKVACPFHKKQFSLETGENLNGEDYCISTYPVKVEDGFVYVGLPS